MSTLTRGTLAKRCGVNPETIRYYERRGILADPARTSSNYRLYTEETVRRVRFIKRAQELGFTLKEIEELLSLRAQPRACCGDVLAKAEAKTRDIDEKIRDLAAMREALTRLTEECKGSAPVSECPILEALDRDDGADAPGKEP